MKTLNKILKWIDDNDDNPFLFYGTLLVITIIFAFVAHFGYIK